MRFLNEVALLAAALFIAGRAIIASFRARYVRVDGVTAREYRKSRFGVAVLPLIAVLAGWLLTHVVWHLLTGHFPYDYTFWFWIPWFFPFAVLAAVATLLLPGWLSGIAHWIEVGICVALLIVEALNVNYFGPTWADWHHPWWNVLIQVLLLLVFLAAVFGAFGSWVAAAVATLVLVGLLIFGLVTDNFAPNTPQAPTATGPSSPSGGGKPKAGGSLTKEQNKAQQQAQESLIVNYNQVNIDRGAALVKKYFGARSVVTITHTPMHGKTTSFKSPVFVIGAENPVGNGPEKRLWSDAVNVPLKPQTLEAEQATINRDPLQAAMVMNGLGKGKVGGISVYHQNPWMQAQGSVDNIKTWAQHCMTQDVVTHLQCARVMAATADLLGRFHSEGVVKRNSTWNYHLTHGGLAVNKVPAVGLNPKQEQNAYFLVVSMTEKTGGCFLRYGFNMGTTTRNGGDQRLAGMTCVPPKAPPKHVVPPKGTPPGHTPPGHTPPPPPPGHTTPPPPHHTCVCVTKRRVSQAPLPPPRQTQPVAPEPSAVPTQPVSTRTPGAPNSSGHNGGGTSNPVVSGTPTPVNTQSHTTMPPKP